MKHELNIIDVVKDYGIELTRKGDLFIGYCCFHHDVNTPNFTVYSETNSFHCFACKASGDAIQFISRMENIPRSEVEKKYIDIIIKDKVKKLTIKKVLNFKKEIYLLTSDIIREFIIKNPNKFDKLMVILRKLDNRLCASEIISYEDGMNILEKLKKVVYYIQGTL